MYNNNYNKQIEIIYASLFQHLKINAVHQKILKKIIVVSIGADKAFVKIQCSFMIKYLSNLGMEKNFLNLIRNIYKIYTASIFSNEEIKFSH